ncbi:hypothetical protein LTS17_008263 [Exophiala oligosperma]
MNKNITAVNGFQGSPFDCAKLTVPLDYTNSSRETLDLALFRVNATKKPVLGSVLINFGGPGGTGAENLPAYAARMAANIGEQWNLISWDPRGTGKTIPFDCRIQTTSKGFNRQKRDDPRIVSANLTAYFLDYGWNWAGTTAEECLAAMNKTGSYIGTAFTARDMIQIVDALGEDGLLRYYGWSYGTALGSYVSAMFPDRVERVVLDGNLNPHDYQRGDYGDFLADADKAYGAFLDECLINKPDCALAKYTNANKTEDLVNTVDLLLQSVAANASSSTEAWQIYSGVSQIIYSKLYFPSTWPKLAETLTSILSGTYNPSTGTASNSTIAPYNLGTWATIGIRASDALWRPSSLEEYLPQVKHQEAVSSFNDPYTSLWLSARWKFQAKEQYKGNFNVTTKHPILYVNGKHDPVTPLQNAYNASQSFHGSAVLPHSGYGHRLVTDPSACAARYIQAYFKNGALPEAGAMCAPDQGPWEMAKAPAASANGDSGVNSTAQNYTSTASSGTCSGIFASGLFVVTAIANIL